MAIRKNGNCFCIDTRTTSYRMELMCECYLVHTYYGKKISADSVIDIVSNEIASTHIYPQDIGPRNIELSRAPQEYGTGGYADFRISPIKIIQTDGSSTLDLRYKDYKITDGLPYFDVLPFPYQNKNESAQTLEITLTDSVTDIDTVLGYTVFEDKDVIVRYTRIENKSDKVVFVDKAFSMQLDFQQPAYDFISLHGAWAQERQYQRTPIAMGMQGFASRRGVTSHMISSFFAICEHTATEDRGDTYGVHQMYSGCQEVQIERNLYGTVRCIAGITEESLRWKLSPKESFLTPAALLTFSSDGVGGMSRNFHTFINENIVPMQWKNKYRSILINNWEATYFNFDEERLLKIAESASKLGIDLFVMDDGWFGHRVNDKSSLGDWFANEERFPNGISHLAEEINRLDMKFGIWVEPEMISPDSELYRAHPDYAIAIPGRDPLLGRSQLVLDFTRKEVVDCIFKQLDDLLSSANISYVKWDMNRSVNDAFSLEFPTDRQGEFYHRYVLGVYDLMGRITQNYPNILLENCSSGGARFDCGMLRFSPQIWTSDDTDPEERVRIQYGTSLGFPVSCMGAHLSASPNHQTWRTTKFKTRAQVAMNGTFGYELDVSKLTDAEKNEIPVQCEFFKKHYELIQQGDFFRLQNPFENNGDAIWAYRSKNHKEILVFAYRSKAFPYGKNVFVKLPADKDMIYVNGAGFEVAGDVLCNVGVKLQFDKGDYVSHFLYFHSKHRV